MSGDKFRIFFLGQRFELAPRLIQEIKFLKIIAHVKMDMKSQIQWPDNKKFAFTIFDDTDYQSMENAPLVYSFLADIGLKTTKTVWPIRGAEIPKIGGATCEDPDYLEWVLSLQKQGFEIALHNATFHTSCRETTIRGIEQFQKLFGQYPKSMANHADCKEGIYWGNSRLTGINESLYNLLHRNKKKDIFQGHVEGSPLFWGDICKEKIKYVRNFVFKDINTLKECPLMPYYDSARPYVNHWFASSEGPEVNAFVSTIAEKNQDRLISEGGACIMYTHLANGFTENGKIHSRFKSLIERIGKMDGWFVPVSTLLDFLLEAKGRHEISRRERGRMERKWLLHKIKDTYGTS